jgi:hypothetical protein
MRHQVVSQDWLTATATADRIVMNPPFEHGQDMEHVRHAFAQLKPGGRLVSVVSRGSVTNSQSAATAFQEWLRSTGASVYPNPEGSFASGFRPTGVATSLVVIDKPQAC